jgi:uncharacterized protein (DUF1501 family)
MLTLFADRFRHDCDGLHRRELLQVGTLGFGGLTLAGLLGARAQAAGYDVVKDKAVVMLNMQGGPTHIETFDPKMTAPSEYRAMFGEVATRLPGVTFGSHFPKLAAMADKLAVVRSYRHGISDHGTAAMHVAAGGNPTGATMGTIYARVAGITNPVTGIPNNAIVIPAAIDPKYREFNAVPQRVTSTGTLPAAYKAFDPSAGGEIIENMKLRIPEARLGERRTLLGRLDALKRKYEATGAFGGADAFQQQAFDVITGGISAAFDLAQEDARLIERYDTSMFDVPAPAVAKRARKKFIKGHSPVSLGKQMLLARRLVEAGCGFVTVTSAGWDMHGQHEFEVADGMPVLGPAVDKAVSAFLEDLQSRGLSEKVLLVMTGEFGRTPRINKDRGRDHWGNLCTLAFAGGGLPMGQIIGRSDRTASVPASDPISSSDVLGTIMRTLLDVGQLRLVSGMPTEIVRALSASTPIAQLA